MSSTPTNSWRGYRGSWQGGCNWNKRGNSYNRYKSDNNPGRDSPSVPGNQTPTHTPDMDFLTPQSSPFLGSIPSTSELLVLRHRELELCPFEFWEVYLPSVSYESASDTEKLVTTFLRFFSDFYSANQLDRIMCDRVIRVDYNDLVYDPDLVAEILNVSELIRDEPERVLGAIGLAVHQILFNRYANDSKERRPPISVQLYNYSPMTSLKSLRSSQYRKCVSVRGIVIRTTNVRARVIRMAFLCSLCKGVQVLPLLDGKYITPTKCIARGCRGRNFFPMKTSPLTESAGWQSISLQELGGGDNVIQRSMECEFNGCLVESCVPGDVVTVTAVVKASRGDQSRTSKDRRSDLMYLRAISVVKPSTNSMFSEDDLMRITELQKTPNLFKLVTNSLSPSTYGHEVVKAGLILGLFGGVTKQQDGDVLVRGESHILVVGDPGQGKSQLLQAVSLMAPRSVFVCGNSSTPSGLTVTLTKEAGGGGDYTLEAGTLVLGDNGVCCIDEFERMNNQQLSLIEAMDQQYIRVAKSGIVCNLPARTSVVAAANPYGGHYNKARTISENVKMSTSLLSRFDLIFVLFDRPDEEMDHQLSERVMASHFGKKRKFISNLKLPVPSSIDYISENDATQMSLSDKLKYYNREEYEPIPPSLLNKYIAYARSKVYPKLSPEAANILRRFYTELRSFMSNCTSIPITTRHLEALIRLTEARARVDLRELATEEDAIDVIGIIRFNLVDVYSDEMGCVKTSRSVQGAGLSQRNQVKALIAELTRISEIRDSPVFSVTEMRQVSDSIGIPALRFEDIIYSLNNQCYLVKKGPLLYQLQTQGCL